MALAFPYKDPNEVLDYVLNWATRLDSGDTIATSVWSLVPAITSGVGDDLLVIDSESETTTTTTVWLSAGTDGQQYELLNRVTTVGGRTFDQTVRIRVKAK